MDEELYWQMLGRQQKIAALEAAIRRREEVEALEKKIKTLNANRCNLAAYWHDSKAKIEQSRASNLATKWSDHKLRRCSIDWAERVPVKVARQQEMWERYSTARAMRDTGMTLKEVGQCFGVSVGRAREILERFSRMQKHGRGRSPVEMHYAEQPARQLRGMSFAVGQARDWLFLQTGSSHG